MIPIRDQISTRQVPVVNYSLIALNILVYYCKCWLDRILVLLQDCCSPTGAGWKMDSPVKNGIIRVDWCKLDLNKKQIIHNSFYHFVR